MIQQDSSDPDRLALPGVPSVVVITASIGHATLRRCAESVQRQDYPTLRHLVVVDGAGHAAGATHALADVGRDKPLDVLVLPHNTGHSQHFGYRIYGALPLLVDEDVVCFLDEDNWIEQAHVSSGIAALSTTGAAWAYSLRTICSDDGNRICADDCDSLGYWPKFATMLPTGELEPVEAARHRRSPNLVDSSCYFLPRPIACRAAPLWQALHADSVVASFLVQRYSGTCSGVSTVNYALGGGSGTPADWFLDGNARLSALYRATRLPWRHAPQRFEPGCARHHDHQTAGAPPTA